MRRHRKERKGEKQRGQSKLIKQPELLSTSQGVAIELQPDHLLEENPLRPCTFNPLQSLPPEASQINQCHLSLPETATECSGRP